MATLDASADGAVTLGNPYVVTKTVDFSTYTLAQNETVAVIDVPADSYVMKLFWEVLTVEGAARNFAIGDGADDDGYVASTTGNTLASGTTDLTLTEAAPNTVTGYTNGKYYSAADQIDVKAVTSGGLTTMVLKVSALIVKF